MNFLTVILISSGVVLYGKTCLVTGTWESKQTRNSDEMEHRKTLDLGITSGDRCPVVSVIAKFVTSAIDSPTPSNSSWDLGEGSRIQ